jgi:hypothetical protein
MLQRFGIIEDVHEAVGKKIDIVITTGKENEKGTGLVANERCEVLSVAIMEDVLQKPDPANPAHQAFYRMMQTSGGRAEIMRAHKTYIELSRRMTLEDRYTRNTVMMIVQPEGGGPPRLVFEPIDMDYLGDTTPSGIGIFFQSHAAAAASGEFLLEMARATERPQMGVWLPKMKRFGPDKPISAKDLLEDYRYAKVSAPPESDVSRLAGITQSYAGKGFGVGYDAVERGTGDGGIGSVIETGAGYTLILDQEGRREMPAEGLSNALIYVNTKDARKSFWKDLFKALQNTEKFK